jgi:hypothetical protein
MVDIKEIIRQYAETHNLEQCLSFIDGINAVSEIKVDSLVLWEFLK